MNGVRKEIRLQGGVSEQLKLNLAASGHSYFQSRLTADGHSVNPRAAGFPLLLLNFVFLCILGAPKFR